MGKNRDFSKFPNAIIVLDNGNVGIGTSTPGAPLDVWRNGTNGLVASFTDGISSNLQIQTTSTGTLLTPTTNTYLALGSNNNERIRISNTGNVGIGTSTPNKNSINRALTVNATTGTAMYELCVGDTTTTAYWEFSGTDTSIINIGNGFLRLGTNNAERVRITNGGNVGIGTTNPTSLLQIGSISSSGVGTTSPNCITMDSTFGTNTIGTNFKFKLFEDSSLNRYGLGVSSGLLEVVSGNGGSIALFTNGANERVRITSGGSVGIGTTSPSANLHISGSGTFVTQNIENSSAWYALYRAKSANAPNYWQWGSWADGSYRLGRDGVADFLLMNGNGVTQLPYQPHFKYGIGSRTITSVTRFGTDFGFTVRTDRDAVDSSYFNKANGRFTAPVAGVYIFGCTIMRDQNAGSGPVDFQVVKNEPNPISQSSASTYGRGYAGSYTVSYEQLTIVVTVKMAANDYVCLDFSGNMSIYDDDSWFYGYLLG